MLTQTFETNHLEFHTADRKLTTARGTRNRTKLNIQDRLNDMMHRSKVQAK